MKFTAFYDSGHFCPRAAWKDVATFAAQLSAAEVCSHQSLSSLLLCKATTASCVGVQAQNRPYHMMLCLLELRLQLISLQQCSPMFCIGGFQSHLSFAEASPHRSALFDLIQSLSEPNVLCQLPGQVERSMIPQCYILRIYPMALTLTENNSKQQP